MDSGAMACGGITVWQQSSESVNNIWNRLGVIAEKPQYPQYSTIERRLQSFKKWPKNKTQKPKDLAESGFAYTGVEDAVRCFHCGNGLKDWEWNDCPWKQHAFHFRNCPHIRLCKGEKYIREVHGETSVEVDGDCDNNVTVPRLSTKRIMEKNIEAILAAKEFGTKDTKIRKAVQHFIKSGKEKFSAVDLIKTTEELEIGGDKNETDSTDKTCKTTECDIDLEKTKSHTECNRNGKETQNEAKNKLETSDCNKNRTETQKDDQDLQQENECLKENLTCKICYDAEACIVTVPCGHMVTCPQCVGPLQKCCLCREPIRGTIRAYFG